MPLNLRDLSCSGYTECVKWLIANRAKVDVLDNNGRTPLDIAEVNHTFNQEKVNYFNEQPQSCAFEKNVADVAKQTVEFA